MANHHSYYREIENPDAYEAAIKARIKENARKGRGSRWLDEDASRQALIEFVAEKSTRGGFLGKMQEALDEWGSLSDGQEIAVRKIMALEVDRNATRAAEAAKAEFVGEVGKRQTFAGLKVTSYSSDEGDFGMVHAYRFRDKAGNFILWNGSHRLFEENDRMQRDVQYGDVVEVAASVKKHHVTKTGVKMTILTRAKVKSVQRHVETEAAK